MKLPEHIGYSGLRVKTRHIMFAIAFAEGVALGALVYIGLTRETHEDRVQKTLEIIEDGMEKSRETPVEHLPDPDPFRYQI